MSIAVNIIGPVNIDGPPGKKMLVSEKNVSHNKINTRQFLVDEDKADKFVKQRKSLNTANRIQHDLSILMSVFVGLFIGKQVKAGGFFGELAATALSGLGCLMLCKNIDKWTAKTCDDNSIKAFDAEEVEDTFSPKKINENEVESKD